MDTYEALKEKFSHIHPLMFQRCVERTKTAGELFDMLDLMPKDYPIAWNQTRKEWVQVDLLTAESKE